MSPPANQATAGVNGAACRGDDVLLREVEQLALEMRVRDFSTPKRIAAMALYHHVAAGLSREEALDRASASVGQRLTMTGGAQRKAESEARAILQFGLPAADFVAPEAETNEVLLQKLTILVLHVSLREVTRARALAYRGQRGGRRARGAPGPTYAAVQRLVQRSGAGDSRAMAELDKILGLITSARVVGASAATVA